jgi:hypothetical protein
MHKTPNFSVWTYLLFPGIAMLLGWGLRGYIGGGPFGAMIPGAMVALAISMLLGFRANFTSLVVVFGVIGIGLGGEMTYGQTLGFLRNPETVWWGNLATTLKGAVWGIGGGAILGLGLIHKRIPKRTIIIAFVVLLIGLLLGFKLINDPKLIYFSDPVNKPRSESWAALLFGAIALIGYLKFKLEKDDFKIIYRFAKWGLIGGGLGFGIGGLWFVLGSYVPDSMFKSWWKMMEFTFGLLLGAGIGYAAWLSRNEFKNEKEISYEKIELGLWKEMLLIFIISLFVYLLFPGLIEPIADRMSYDDGILTGIIGDILRIFINYAFYGFVMVLIVIYKNELAWQIGITLTFCHAIIDLMRDLRPQPDVSVNPWIQLVVVAVVTMIVAYLVAKYRNEKNVNNSMFQILVWSTISIAFASLGFDLLLEGGLKESGFANLIVRTFFVHIVFLSSAIYISRKSSLINKINALS